MKHALWMWQNQKSLIVHHQGGFIPNPNRWVSRMETSSLDPWDPWVRAKAMCTQATGLVNNSESMELVSFSKTQNNKGKKGHQPGR